MPPDKCERARIIPTSSSRDLIEKMIGKQKNREILHTSPAEIYANKIIKL
jgi:hypothetical protein